MKRIKRRVAKANVMTAFLIHLLNVFIRDVKKVRKLRILEKNQFY